MKITRHDICVKWIKMPYKIKATHTVNPDATYTVFVNDRLSIEEQRKGYLHEVKHIHGADLYSVRAADEIESDLRQEC